MHRGRPRSRKHVEVHPSVDTNNKKKTRLNPAPPLHSNPTGQPNDSFSPLFPGTVGQTKDALIVGGARASATTQNLSPSPYKESNRLMITGLVPVILSFLFFFFFRLNASSYFADLCVFSFFFFLFFFFVGVEECLAG